MTTIPLTHTAQWAVYHRSCFGKEDRKLKTAGGTGIRGQDQAVTPKEFRILNTHRGISSIIQVCRDLN